LNLHTNGNIEGAFPFSRGKGLGVIIREKNGLSQAISTLIMLVLTILIALIVTYYTTNVTTSRTQVEDVTFSKVHIWVNSTGAVAGLKLKNLGGRDILIDKFTVRGVEEPWSDVYYYRVPSGTSINGDINVTSYSNLSGASVTIDSKVFNQSTADIPLISGGELLVYLKGPDNVMMADLGKDVGITVFTNNAQYITDCNVESATTQ
jgi:hypothetical protein